MILPEVISNFNVYDNGNNKLIGVSGEVSLSELAAVTATVSGAGLLGDMNLPVIGQVGSMEQEIPFNVLNVDVFNQFRLNKPVTLVLRGDVQSTDTATGEFRHNAMKITWRGYVKKITPGKVKAAESMGASVTLELVYIHIRFDDKTAIKIDKMNSVYQIGDEDLLEEIKKNC